MPSRVLLQASAPSLPLSKTSTLLPSPTTYLRRFLCSQRMLAAAIAPTPRPLPLPHHPSLSPLPRQLVVTMPRTEGTAGTTKVLQHARMWWWWLQAQQLAGAFMYAGWLLVCPCWCHVTLLLPMMATTHGQGSGPFRPRDAPILHCI